MRHKTSFSKTGAFMLLMGMFLGGCSDMELKKSDVLPADPDNIPVTKKTLMVCVLPDAAVSDIQFTGITGNTFSYTFKVTNVGGDVLPLSNMYFQAYVSQDATYGAGDQPAGGSIFYGGPASLASGESYVQSWYYNPTFPQDISVYKYVIVTIASYPAVTECGTANNSIAQRIAFDIPRNGLVAFYPFSGNANDVSGHNLHGTANGTTPAVDRFGIANNTYSFDGVDDYITMGNPSLLQINNAITVSGWFNVRAFTAGHSPGHDSKAIITKLYFDPLVGGNPRRGYHLDADYYGNGTPSAAQAIYSSDNLGNITSFLSSYVGNTYTTNEWVFFCFAINGTSYKYYHNGALVNSYTMPNTILTDGSLGDLTIGTYGGGFRFNGWIDDIAIYNRALTDAEVTQLYHQTISK